MEGQSKAIRGDNLLAACSFAASGIRYQFSPAVFAVMFHVWLYVYRVLRVARCCARARCLQRHAACVPVNFTDKFVCDTVHYCYLIL